MNPDNEITIQKISNGWIVRPCYFEARPYATPDEDIYVFNSFVKLIEWLDNHFTKPEKEE